MAKKRNKQTDKSKQKRDSIFTEAWENMNSDLQNILPSFLANKLQDGQNKLWVMVVVMIVELVVLGVVVKLLYDWFVS